MATQYEQRSDELYKALHRDHEEVTRILTELQSIEDRDRAERMFHECALNLMLHTRAEEQIVYRRFEDEEPERIRHAFAEHHQVDELLDRARRSEPGSEEFVRLIGQILDSVREHVQEEENDLLPSVADAMEDDERKELVRWFQERKQELRPDVEEQLEGPSRKPSRKQGAQRRGQQPAAKRARAGRGGGDLEDHTVNELQKMAKDAGIQGRSRMRKKELVRELKRHR